MPRLPHATAFRPDERATSAMSVTAVLFPLVPVTAMTGEGQNRNANSTSLRMGSPRDSAEAIGPSCSGTPGLTTSMSASAVSRSLCPPSSASRRPSGRSASTAARSSGVSCASVTETRAPTRHSSRAAASPLRPKPTTVTRRPAHESPKTSVERAEAWVRLIPPPAPEGGRRRQPRGPLSATRRTLRWDRPRSISFLRRAQGKPAQMVGSSPHLLVGRRPVAG